MKKVIDGKTYNTETAEKIGNEWNGLSPSDFRNWEETLYKTKKGNFFIVGKGGAMTRWSKSNGNTSWGSSGVIAIDKAEALEWCENYVSTETIERHFDLENA